jgi:hypothetical protein
VVLEETAVFKTSMLKHAVMAAIVEAKENQLGLEAITSSSSKSRAIVATDDLESEEGLSYESDEFDESYEVDETCGNECDECYGDDEVYEHEEGECGAEELRL